jgi:hypothetical protein
MPNDTPDDVELPPPAEIPTDITNRLQSQPAETLHTIAEYATQLANTKTERADIDDIEEQDEAVDEDLPSNVPARASKTQKTINGNDYWYWQWRDGEQIKSEYIGPVNSDR